MSEPENYLRDFERSNYRGITPKRFMAYLESEGYEKRTPPKGSHFTFKHPKAPSLITVPANKKELAPGFARRQAKTVKEEKTQ